MSLETFQRPKRVCDRFSVQKARNKQTEGCHQLATQVDSAQSRCPVKSEEPERSPQNTYHEADTGLQGISKARGDQRGPLTPSLTTLSALAPEDTGRNEWQGNCWKGAIEGTALRGFGLDPGGEEELSGISMTGKRLRPACQMETGMEAQRKPGRAMDGWA